MNSKKIFYQSSLPRTGSTLLQNLLAQNPQIHSTPTSGISRVISASYHSFAKIKEFRNERDFSLHKKAHDTFIKTGLDSYFSSITNRPYVIDKGRTWLIERDILKKFDKSPKIITLVRDLRSIISSLENYYQNDPFTKYHMLDKGFEFPSTINKRTNFFLQQNTLPDMLEAIKDIFTSYNPNKICFVRYEDLCSNPNIVLKQIYNYLEIPYFKHNFNDIKPYTYENDNFIFFGEHTISPTLKPSPKSWERNIPKNIADKLYEDYKWYFKTFNYTK